MPYLNLDPDYFSHPKTRRLVALLGPGSESLPLRLWCYLAKHHAEDGKLKGYSAAEIETVLDWKGKKGEAVAILIRVGFLHKTKTGFVCHDWLDHEGHISAFRKRAKNAAKSRWSRLSPKPRDHATSTPQALPEGSPSNPPALPSLAVPNQPIPQKEKDSLHVVRPKTENNDEMLKEEFVLRLHGEELQRWTLRVARGLTDRGFQWSPKTGDFENDMKSLIYKFPDETKKTILYQARRLIDDKLNWPLWIEYVIKEMMRSSTHTRIVNPFGWVLAMSGKPNEFVAKSNDSLMNALAEKMSV